jgi:aryl-alcohol dehydrogenase-like predicted oxidoreductase
VLYSLFREANPTQMHYTDRRMSWEGIWQAMELLVQQGKVLYVGSSDFRRLGIQSLSCWNIAQRASRIDKTTCCHRCAVAALVVCS